jgi:thiamine phosphate synthase YjbQ (UPF0047 family)
MIDLKIKTKVRIELIDITDKVNHALAEIGADNGLCNLFVTHTTAAVIVSENWEICSRNSSVSCRAKIPIGMAKATRRRIFCP